MIDPVVRTGVPEDLDDIMRIAIMACAENGFVEANPTKLLEHIYPALHLDHGIMGMIGPVGGPIEAAVLLRVGTVWYSDTPLIEEKAIFVAPSMRSAKGGRGVKLCRFSKQVADKLGLKLLIGVLSEIRAEGKIRMYQRVFGEPSGGYWIYDPVRS